MTHLEPAGSTPAATHPASAPPAERTGGPRPAADLAAEVADLRHQLDALRHQLATVLDAAPSPTPVLAPAAAPPASGATHTPAGDRQPDRRSLLRHAGAAAAGAVATGAALALGEAPAAAVNGDAVTCGQMRTATTTTELRYTGAAMSSEHVFVAHDTTGVSTFFPSAIGGIATGEVKHGVLGQTGVPEAVGVIGLALDEQAIGGMFSAGLHFGFGAVLGKSTIRLNAFGPAPRLRNTNGTFVAGDIVADDNDDVSLCVVAGATGATAKWRKLGGPATAGQLHMHTAPKRLYDSRPGFAPLGGVKLPLANAATRTLDGNVVIGAPGPTNPVVIPPTATAALVNVTIVNTSAAGFLALFDGTIAWPGNSTLNWYQNGSVVGNMAVVRTTNSKIRAYVSSASSTDFLIDVAGWYE